MEIVFIIPCRNEENGLREVLKKIPSNSMVIVVDNGSSDKTSEVAKRAGANVLFEEKKGKGRAFRKALSHLKNLNFDFVAMIDGDNTYNPGEITKFLDSMDKQDVVVGNRLNSELKPVEMNFFYKAGNIFLTMLANLLYAGGTKDLCSGYWCFKKEALEKIGVRANNFDLEADLFSQCKNKNLRLGFVPITYGKRIGKEKLSIIDSVTIIKRLLVNRF